MAFLTELWVRSWREAMPEIDFDSRRAWLATFLGTERHATTVATSALGAALGFMTVVDAYIHQLVVGPTAKGTGVAVKLLDAAKASTETLALDVNQANARAVRFYEREGFRVTAAGRNPTSGLPTWRMCWTP